MKSIQAIVAGCAFVIIVILLMQLLYIFIAVGYNALANDFPWLKDITGIFRYLIGIPVFVAVMFAGGYITANVVEKKDRVTVLLHCVAVAIITAGGMLYSAMENASLTVTGIVVFVLALTASSVGGLYWQKQ